MIVQPALDLGMSAQAVALCDGNLLYWPGFIAEPEATALLADLQGLNWSQDSLTIAGKHIPIPRLQAWYGEPGTHYQYSGLRLQPQPFTPGLLALKLRIEAVSRYRFNSVLANLYRNGSDSVGWHSDDEPELGPSPAIASLSFGAARRFRLKHKKRPLQQELMLKHGDLIIMEPPTQRYWHHQYRKRGNLLTVASTSLFATSRLPHERLVQEDKVYYAYDARLYSLLGIIILLMTWKPPAHADNAPEQKHIMGWVEQIHLLPMDLTVNAKLDTGALTSSLHAEHISYFKRDGEDWVRFEYHTPHRKKHRGKAGKADEVFVLERPVVRTTLIKRHQLSSMQRTVITLPVQIGEHTYEPQFTLTNRSNFIYPVLLGRRFLRDTTLVDASKTHLQSLQLPGESTGQHAKAEEKTSEESEDNE